MFRDNLKQFMEEKDLTLSALSKESGIGKSSISQYLSGKNIPNEERIKHLADILECKVEDLVSEHEEKAEFDYPTGDEVWDVPVTLAAKLMHKKNDFVYLGLRQGIFPFGYAVKISSQWTYYISSKKFTEYTGIELKGKGRR